MGTYSWKVGDMAKCASRYGWQAELNGFDAETKDPHDHECGYDATDEPDDGRCAEGLHTCGICWNAVWPATEVVDGEVRRTQSVGLDGSTLSA